MGDWAYSYDALDRIMSATPGSNAPSQYAGRQACWAYDAFGNRTLEAVSSAACQTKPTPQALVAYNLVNNRVSSSTLSSATLTAGSYQYDAAGNTLFDGNNRYWYDAEGQLCAVQSLRTTGAAVVQYVYDAEGARIAKGTLAAAPAASTSSCSPPLGAGFTLTARYLLGLGGDQVTELNGAGVWQHSNVWAGGKLVGTYDMKELHFDLADPLGTKRVQANASGQVDEYCMSLPFGNDVNNPVAANCVAPNPAPATADDATEHHFTQKERDSETGNDYFFARYYSSALGRFTTPDWSAKEEPVPYANMGDPQSLNLFAYVANNPLRAIDPEGHCGADGDDGDCGSYTTTQVAAIIFHEVNRPGAESADALDGLYIDLAHAIYNSSGKRIEHAPDTTNDIDESSTTFREILTSTEKACKDAINGVDPTDGADLYNNRFGIEPDTKDRIFVDGSGAVTGTAPVIKLDGPFTRKVGRGKHVRILTFWETFERSKDGKPRRRPIAPGKKPAKVWPKPHKKSKPQEP